MSMSSVTMSGFSAWICLSASSPLRAVPATSNSPESAIVCEMRRRMNALSSTTSTRARSELMPASFHRAHAHAAVVHVERHAAPEIQPDVFGDDRHTRRLERGARCDDVPLADVYAARGE